MIKLFITSLILCLSSNLVKADELELGAGSFATSLPKYLGSDEQHNYVLPFPYFYYKSDQLEVNRNAFTGYLWHNKQWFLDISAAGSIPVKSDKTKVRQGMPDLDFVGEIGPVLKYYLMGDHNSQQQSFIGFHTRRAFSTDLSSLHSVGWRYGPTFEYNKKIPSFLSGNMSIQSKVNIDFADDDYLNYYYGVDNQYVQEGRHSFSAKSGYKSSSISLGFSWNKNKVWIGSFVKYQNLKGTKQQNSPLVKKEDNWSVGIGLVWIFHKKHY